ncbi:MAG: hypothetical protein ABI806_12915 [Candidatus Solibacter sp.]
MRWEFSGIPSEANGLVGTIDQAASLSTSYTSSNLTVKKGGQWYNDDWNDFAPRAGFAWDVKGDGKTAVRGSVGVFYDRMIGATISSVDGATPGFGQDVFVYPNANGTDVRAGDGIPATPQPPAPILTLPNSRSTSISVFSPGLRTPYVVQYSLNVQRELPLHVVLEVGYVSKLLRQPQCRRRAAHWRWCVVLSPGQLRHQVLVPHRRRLRQYGPQYLPRTSLLRHRRIPGEAFPHPRKHAITALVEGYNIFNNVNFGNPTVSLTTPQTFGKLTGMVGSPRILQVALRYDF